MIKLSSSSCIIDLLAAAVVFLGLNDFNFSIDFDSKREFICVDILIALC